MTSSDDGNVDIDIWRPDGIMVERLKIMQIWCPVRLCVAVRAKSLPTHVLEYLASSFTDLTLSLFVLCVLCAIQVAPLV